MHKWTSYTFLPIIRLILIIFLMVSYVYLFPGEVNSSNVYLGSVESVEPVDTKTVNIMDTGSVMRWTKFKTLDITAFEDDIKQRVIQSYETDNNCTVFYDAAGHGIRQHSKKTEHLGKCTNDIFRNYIRKTDGLPFQGTLTGTKDKPAFHPTFCHFLDAPNNCFNAKNIHRKITIFGDSQAQHLTKGYVNTLTENGFNCTLTKQENRSELRDPHYFQTSTMKAEFIEGIPSVFRKGGDKCYMYRCVLITPPYSKESRLGHNITFTIEYISHTNLMENTLYIKEIEDRGPFRRHIFTTFGEYIFKHYFPFAGFPDYLVIRAPFHHVKWHASLSQAALDITYLDGLMQIYLPSKTRIFWIPDVRECELTYPIDIPKITRNGMGPNQRIQALNNVLYAVLKARFLDPEGCVNGFLDLGKISCPITCKFHKNAAHMYQGWYDMVANYILQLSCD